MIAIMGSFVFARERKGIIGGVCAARCIYLSEPGAWSHAAGKTRARTALEFVRGCCENRAQLRLLRGVCGGDWGWPLSLRWCHPVCHSALIDLIAMCAVLNCVQRPGEQTQNNAARTKQCATGRRRARDETKKRKELLWLTRNMILLAWSLLSWD